MEEPVRQADGAVVIEGCHKPPETIRTLSARVAPRVLDERAEPPDLLVASYGQVDDDSKPAVYRSSLRPAGLTWIQPVGSVRLAAFRPIKHRVPSEQPRTSHRGGARDAAWMLPSSLRFSWLFTRTDVQSKTSDQLLFAHVPSLSTNRFGGHSLHGGRHPVYRQQCSVMHEEPTAHVALKFAAQKHGGAYPVGK
eukprot:CAMPEP_0184392398 /NCGR_PEP_ID=MMETSP0007-20130409/26891_1 /TAXON_ID=97485 /ORGANISM="Prymnesium parvum, Strain Texoma1" /LENGTH=193 /DNA_ID=CAMNT_0026742953 /DNA_START=16 /DNA_END=597 /DNA_ORIENTATION=+